MKYIFLILSMAFMIIGCAAGSVKEMKAESSERFDLEVKQNYQVVYKNILHMMDECRGEGWDGSSASNIKSTLFNDLGEAQISSVVNNHGDQRYYLLVDIKKVENEVTRVEGYAYYSTWKNELLKVRTWAADPNAGCVVEGEKKHAPVSEN